MLATLPNSTDKAIQLLHNQKGVLCTADMLHMGIHPRTLYKLRDTGVLEQLSRGVYRLASQEPIEHLDLVTVAARCPKAIICLVSALSFHQLTTQIPHSVSIALPCGSEAPRIEYPPISVHRFSAESYGAGIDEHIIDGVSLQVYNPEKTIADCFKFRNKIGMDVVLEALKFYLKQKQFNVSSLLEYGRICHVEKIMKPYLEALL
jgi:predicted transcriptional regulator of viral defense system